MTVGDIDDELYIQTIFQTENKNQHLWICFLKKTNIFINMVINLKILRKSEWPSVKQWMNIVSDTVFL